MKKDYTDLQAEFRDFIRRNYQYCRSFKEQEEDLRLYKEQGDMAARDRFISAQVCWIGYLLRSVYGLTSVLFELIQDACLHAMELLDKYDLHNAEKASFRTYARVSLVRRANVNLESKTDGLAVKSYVRRESRFARLTFKSLLNEGMRETEALRETTVRFYRRFSKQDYLSLPPYKQEKAEERVRNLLLLGVAPISLDAPLSETDPEGETHLDCVADEAANPEDIAVREDTLRAILAAIESDLLDDRDRYIVEHYVGLNEVARLSVTEIARKLGVSRQRVSAILAEIRVKLRKTLGVESA